jgi:phosphatidylglycerophosphate synthase
VKQDQMPPEKVLRRPIGARNTQWAARTARALAGMGLRPNTISVFSMVFGTGAAICIFFSGRSPTAGGRVLWLLATAACIQLRLLCNLFDGMVAIEGGFKTKAGEVYNELPDRWSDLVVLVATGYSLYGVPYARELGWTAAVLAVLTAYVRSFGGAAGASQYFCGPMAKQQRMAVLTISCVITAILTAAHFTFEILPWALGLIIVGCIVTIARRISLIIAELDAK